MSDVKVRIGVPADVDAAMNLAMGCVEENGLTNPNPIKILNGIWDALNQEKAIFGVIGETHNFLEGGILLRMESLWYSDDKLIIEQAVFVRPQHRKGSVNRAKLLCEFAKKVSERLDIPLLIGVLSNHRTSGKIRLYERQFGPGAGAYWIYGGKTGQPGAMDHLPEDVKNMRGDQ